MRPPAEFFPVGSYPLGQVLSGAGFARQPFCVTCWPLGHNWHPPVPGTAPTAQIGFCNAPQLTVGPAGAAMPAHTAVLKLLEDPVDSSSALATTSKHPVLEYGCDAGPIKSPAAAAHVNVNVVDCPTCLKMSGGCRLTRHPPPEPVDTHPIGVGRGSDWVDVCGVSAEGPAALTGARTGKSQARETARIRTAVTTLARRQCAIKLCSRWLPVRGVGAPGGNEASLPRR